jgi:ADP-L-glycero-D-manno-heptose 6-epimerase
MQLDEDRLIVVTGGVGFIGSGVLAHLNAQGFKNIVVVDHLGNSAKWKNLVGKCFVEVLDKHQLFGWLQGRQDTVQAFVHLGACSSTVEMDASYLLENNYRYTVNLAEYALQHGQRFIYASSAATYGDGALGFSDDEERLQTLAPLNMYGYSKHLFDLWAKNQGVLDKLVGLKYFNVFGPNEYHKGRMASAVTHLLPSAKKDGLVRLFKSSEPSLFADGEQKRDFIYVKDAVRMTCAFLKNDANGVYNVGCGMAGSWNDVANAVFEAIAMPVNIQYIDMPADLIGKYQNYTCADMYKTKKVLGKDAECMPLKDAIIEYVRNYLSQGKTW